MRLTISAFNEISDFIYAKTGIRLDSKKINFLSIRILKRALALEMEDLDEYIKYLRFFDEDGKELQNLINLITINETYFFRDFSQLVIFAEYCLDEILKNKEIQKSNTIRIWCAGCSIGAEPYTLAIIVREMIPLLHNWHVEILATDIDVNVLEQAKTAIYTKRHVKDVPESYLHKYFSETPDGMFALSNEIKSMVVFEHLNLTDKFKLRQKIGFDFIFCRNVLIYFDDVSRKKVVDHFYIALNDGGYIFLSSTESLNRITTAFKLKKVEHDNESYLLYCKEG